VLVLVGAAVIWLPYAALTVLSLLVALSPRGLGEGAPIAVVGLGFAIVVPVATWVALRRRSVATALLLIVVGAVIPIAWALLLRPDHSEPLHLITSTAAAGGAALILGAVLMLSSRVTR
jgi:hypothetical protein